MLLLNILEKHSSVSRLARKFNFDDQTRKKRFEIHKKNITS